MANIKKCMKGYTMNSRGSCVTTKKTNKKPGRPRNIGNALQPSNRAVLPCCMNGCNDLNYFTAYCNGNGQDGYQLTVWQLWHQTIGGSVGCEFSQGVDQVRREALHSFKNGFMWTSGDGGGGGDSAYCDNNGLLWVEDSAHMCQQHPFDTSDGTCIFPFTRNTACAGYYTEWSSNGFSGTEDEWEWTYDSQGITGNYLCGNWNMMVSPGPPKDDWGRRGGPVKRKGNRRN